MKEDLGIRIKELRIKQGLTQVDFAKRLGYKHPSIISEIESGKKGLSANKLPLVANVLGVDINSLFFVQIVHKMRTDVNSA
ncbi:helix-turn-helix domain-containing protein [Peribacillus frigoritolerans]|uniref:helix-turn-helix domain-containing protein n=1 Tax=Peribacillus frigoritolerans TaxID=450367 RepID=UPI0022827192|nr:helix-turn-helix transcriptional regulator [Peribacillus frigoritolerans]MCY9003307.1 helix-turn-helix domain-containing protein [Peribacillus frigoritolerans]WHY15727.1 helix-turn-helix transcriptional regulator [Peribacillus frigoritolerans]